MSKRLQVLLAPNEYRTFQKIAHQLGVSLGEWVRLALRKSAKEVSPQASDKKIKAIRVASRHSFPTSNIDQMNAEIRQGYLSCFSSIRTSPCM